MSGFDFDPSSAIVAGLGLIAVTNHAVRRPRSCAALLGPQSAARSRLRGLRFR
jgi:hypothetical protein